MRKEVIYLLTVRRRVQRKKELKNFLTKWRGYKKSCKQTKHIIFSKWVILCTLKLDHVCMDILIQMYRTFLGIENIGKEEQSLIKYPTFFSLLLLLHYLFIHMKNKKWF